MPTQWGAYWQSANGGRHWSQLGAQAVHHQHRAKAGWGRVRMFVLMEEMEGVYNFNLIFFWMGWSKDKDPLALSLHSLALGLDGRVL